MAKLIKLTYQQIIDWSSDSAFERAIFDASYQEFIKKFDAYNKSEEYTTFEELVRRDGRAHSLHFKLTFAVGHILDTLGKQIPGLRDQLGNSIPFKFAELNLLSSSIVDKKKHRVAVRYVTEVLTLHEVIGDQLLLSIGNEQKRRESELGQTFMVKAQTGLSISGYSKVMQDVITEPFVRISHDSHLFTALGII